MASEREQRLDELQVTHTHTHTHTTAYTHKRTHAICQGHWYARTHALTHRESDHPEDAQKYAHILDNDGFYSIYCDIMAAIQVVAI